MYDIDQINSPNIAEEISDVNINLKTIIFGKDFKNAGEKIILALKNSSNIPADNTTSREGRKSPNPPDKIPWILSPIFKATTKKAIKSKIKIVSQILDILDSLIDLLNNFFRFDKSNTKIPAKNKR